jgi:iron complex outermembrane recepter protein
MPRPCRENPAPPSCLASPLRRARTPTHCAQPTRMNATPTPFARRLATAALATALLPLSFAQVAPPGSTSLDDEEIRLEAFTVTGTNIRRLDRRRSFPSRSSAPTRSDARDASQPSELLAGVAPGHRLPGNETATLGATARGDNASVSAAWYPLLQHADPAQRPASPAARHQPGRGRRAHPLRQLNQLPNRGLEQRRGLRDGASSIYGTDAVAGVINYITRRDFVGTELALRYAQTEIGDGQECAPR